MARRGYIGEYIRPEKCFNPEPPPLNDARVNKSGIYSTEDQIKSSSRSHPLATWPEKIYICRVESFIDQEPEPIYKESYEQLISKKLTFNFPFKLEKTIDAEDGFFEKKHIDNFPADDGVRDTPLGLLH